MPKKKEKEDVQLILNGQVCKTTCKVLSILAKVFEVLLIIATICCGVCGIVVGFAGKEMDLNAVVNALKEDATFPQEVWEIAEVSNFLSMGHEQQVSAILLALVAVTVYLAFASVLARYVYLLFKHLTKGRTPFTLENVDILQKIGVWIFVLVCTSILSSIIVTLAAGSTKLSIHISLSTIAIGFWALVLAVIFRHGVELENRNKNK